jgi:phage shock protein PspC (stress-responsive transcriptional regulator)
LALLGGSGAVLYLVAWVIVPVEDADGAAPGAGPGRSVP